MVSIRRLILSLILAKRVFINPSVFIPMQQPNRSRFITTAIVMSQCLMFQITTSDSSTFHPFSRASLSILLACYSNRVNSIVLKLGFLKFWWSFWLERRKPQPNPNHQTHPISIIVHVSLSARGQTHPQKFSILNSEKLLSVRQLVLLLVLAN